MLGGTYSVGETRSCFSSAMHSSPVASEEKTVVVITEQIQPTQFTSFRKNPFRKPVRRCQVVCNTFHRHNKRLEFTLPVVSTSSVSGIHLLLSLIRCLFRSH